MVGFKYLYNNQEVVINYLDWEYLIDCVNTL
jgi:hypothetical protein